MELPMGSVRRVQKTAQGQYTITLPKALVESLGIEKGAELEFSLDEKLGIILRRRGRRGRR